MPFKIRMLHDGAKDTRRWSLLVLVGLVLMAGQALATYRIPSGQTLLPVGTPKADTQVFQSPIINDTQWAYFVWLPPTYDANSAKLWPCLINIPAFNYQDGSTGNLSDIFTTHCLNGGMAEILQNPSSVPAAIANRFVVITCYVEWTMVGSIPGHSDRLHSLFANITKSFKIDTTAISMMGYCFGAGVSYTYSAAYPSFPAHLVLIAGNDNWASTFNLTNACKLKNISMRQYASHNCTCNDSQTAEAAYLSISACGTHNDSITFTPSSNHEVWYWDGIDTTTSLYNWMLTPRNPTAAQMTIEQPRAKASLGLETRLTPQDQMEIIDVNGQRLYRFSGNGSQAGKMIPPLSRGMYLVRITRGDESSARIFLSK
jgi:hypothetical protein